MQSVQWWSGVRRSVAVTSTRLRRSDVPARPLRHRNAGSLSCDECRNATDGVDSSPGLAAECLGAAADACGTDTRTVRRGRLRNRSSARSPAPQGRGDGPRS